MEYYSNQISRLIEEFSRCRGLAASRRKRLAFHVINMPLDQVEVWQNQLLTQGKMCGIVKCAVHLQIGKPVRFAEIRIATRKRSWSLRHRGIWQRMKRQENITEYIMCSTGQSLRCWESAREISV